MRVKPSSWQTVLEEELQQEMQLFISPCLSCGQGKTCLVSRRNRFAGLYMAYNNLEARWQIASFKNYILPGLLGIVGLYDVGRVWQKDDRSHQWHNGVGGGFYFAPAQMALFQCSDILFR